MARFELTDRQYNKLLPFLPPQHSGKVGHPYEDHRRVLNGIAWTMRTGATWRDLPARYGPWQTCYNRFVRWNQDGTWAKIVQATRSDRQLSRAIGDVFGDMPSIKPHSAAPGAAIPRARVSATPPPVNASRFTTLTLWPEGDAN